MKQIIWTYGLSKETDTAIMMLYQNKKAMDLSRDGNTDFFDIIAEVIQGDIQVLYMFIICLEYFERQ